MLNYVCCSLLILAKVILTQNVIQEYVIQKDFFNVFKAAEFSIYDPGETNVYYRIESNYGLMQNVKVIANPSTQEIGELHAKLNFLLYKAEISILDSQINQWINGSIEQNFQWFTHSFDINWNGQYIKLEKDGIISLTSKFYDEDQQLLAQIRRRINFNFQVKYDMKIFSNKYPTQIYLLGLSALHRVSSSNTVVCKKNWNKSIRQSFVLFSIF
jgi:hypothetical protein